MRVISGIYKGKKLEGFNIEGTRPTMDRVKESLFGSIQTYIPGRVCLDLFAGSGSLGIEALSNGASKCYFIDNSPNIWNILASNLKDIKDAELIKSDYKKFLKETDLKFDIIFLDPPYSLNLIGKAINIILERDLLNKNGLIVCEYENEVIKCDLELLKEKKYGSKNIRVYKKMN